MTVAVISTSMAAAATEAMPQVDVEVSFLSDPVEGPVFRTIVDKACGGNTKRGRPRYEDQFSTGTASVTLDDATRRFDPSNTSSPHSPNLIPNRRGRILARYNNVTYTVFDGYADAWPVSNDGSTRFAVPFTDGFKRLAKSKLPDGNMPWNLEVIKDRPLVWHKLGDVVAGGVIYDSSGNGYHGLYGATSATYSPSSIAGLVAQSSDAAADFDGTNDFAWVAKDSTWVAEDRYSVEFWFQTTQVVAAGKTVPVFGTGSELNSRNLWLSENELLTNGTVGTSAAVNDGAIHHIVLTSAGVTGTVYLDGVLQTGGADTLYVTGTPVGGLFLGFVPGLLTNNVSFDGTIDELVLYDYELSAARILAHYNAGKAGASGAWGGDATGIRLGRILDLVDYPTLDRDIDTGQSTCGPQSALSGDALAAVQKIAVTEDGQTYMGVDGAMSDRHTFALVHRQRHAPLTATRSVTSQASFRDRTTSAGYEYQAITFATSDELIANDVTRTRTGGSAQRVTDEDSIRRYGVESDSKSGEWADDDQAFQLANYHLARHKNAQVRVTSITIDPLVDPSNLFPIVLGYEIGTRVTVYWTPHGAAAETSQESIIEGVEHDWDNKRWTTTWRLSPAETLPFWILGTSVLDTTTRLAA